MCSLQIFIGFAFSCRLVLFFMYTIALAKDKWKFMEIIKPSILLIVRGYDVYCN
jgi:hypothetical protein